MKRVIIITLFLLVSYFSITYAQQNTYTVQVNYNNITPREDSLLFEAFFNLLDSSNQVFTADTINHVVLTLQNGQSYTVEAVRPQTPYYVVLVLDTSGSMYGVSESLQTAARASVDGAPDRAQFAVVSFNQRITRLQGEFTSSQQIIDAAILEADAVPGSGTCVHDAAWEALDLLANKPPGRRAVILFSDGIDETDSGDICSQHSAAQVIERALDPQAQTPFFTIGFQGTSQATWDKQYLADLANRTRGFFISVNDQQNLQSAFDAIMEILESQWYIQAAIYPSQGLQTVQLMPVLDDNTQTTPANIQLNVTQTYRPPADFQLSISGLYPDPASRVFVLELSIAGQSPDIRIKVDVKDENGLDIFSEFPVQNPQGPIQIPVDVLQAGHQYTISVSAYDVNNALIDDPVERNFTYDMSSPPTLDVLVDITEVRANDGETLDLYFDLQGQDQISLLQLAVFDENNIAVDNVGGHIDFTIRSAKIPLSALEAGASYRATLTALGAQGQRLAEPATYDFKDPRDAEVLQMRITNVDYDKGSDALSFNLIATSSSEVKTLQIVILSSKTRAAVDTRQIEGITGTIPIPTDNLTPGASYVIELMPQDRTGNPLFEEPIEYDFEYPAEKPGTVDKFVDYIKSPLPLAVCLSVFILLTIAVVLSYWNKRQKRAKKQAAVENVYQTPTDILGRGRHRASTTDRYRTGSVPPTRQMENNERDTVIMPSRTKDKDTIAQLPAANLTIRQSQTQGMQGRAFRLNRIKTVIGRINGNDISLIGDDRSISREHLELAFSKSNNCYLVTVLSGQQNATRIDGRIYKEGEKASLPNDRSVRIEIGNLENPRLTVVMDFEIEQQSQR